MSQEEVQSTGKVIKLSDILALMAEGKTRKEINAIYGETDAAMKIKVWSHPKLKGKKTVKVPNITLEDDTEEAEANLSQEADAILNIYTPVEEVVTPEETIVEDDTQEEVINDSAPVEETVAPPVASSRSSW